MKQTQYTSTPNRCVMTVDGEEVWISRSCAVVNTIIIKHEGKRYCLMGKRGKGCPDEVGSWVLPCGYLDGDETLASGAMRELLEESGLNYTITQSEIPDAIVLSNYEDGQPWRVNSNPIGKGNASHHFGAYIELPSSHWHLPILSTQFCEPDEVDQLKWINIDDIWSYKVGFNHDETVKLYLKYINKNYTLMQRFIRWVNDGIETFSDFFR